MCVSKRMWTKTTECPNAGVLIYAAFAIVQVTQVAVATPTFGVYDSDNYPQARTMHLGHASVHVALMH